MNATELARLDEQIDTWHALAGQLNEPGQQLLGRL